MKTNFFVGILCLFGSCCHAHKTVYCSLLQLAAAFPDANTIRVITETSEGRDGSITPRDVKLSDITTMLLSDPEKILFADDQRPFRNALYVLGKLENLVVLVLSDLVFSGEDMGWAKLLLEIYTLPKLCSLRIGLRLGSSIGIQSKQILGELLFDVSEIWRKAVRGPFVHEPDNPLLEIQSIPISPNGNGWYGRTGRRHSALVTLSR